MVLHVGDVIYDKSVGFYPAFSLRTGCDTKISIRHPMRIIRAPLVRIIRAPNADHKGTSGGVTVSKLD